MKGIFGTGAVFAYIFAIIFNNTPLALLASMLVYVEIHT